MSNIPTSIGRYEILGSIGRGGMGSLFLALDPKLDRQLAIKLLRDDDDDLRERFAREARAAARLRHPNIVTIFDVGEHEGQPFIAMEYIQGQTLAEVVRGNVPLSLVRKLELMESLCDGLGFAHKGGIIHRDIKPANLMLDADGSLKILDFGIARASESSGMTQAGMLIGTLNYMSPEQVSGQPVDLRSDLFAVGAVFYELLAYRQAFPGGLMAGILNKIVSGQPEPLPTLVPDIDPQIVGIVERALQKDPDRRYPDLPTMRQDIAAARARVAAVAPTRVLGTTPSADASGETRYTPPPSSSGSRRTTDLEGLAKRRAEQIQGHLAEAERKLAAGDAEGAVAAAEQALLLDADHAKAHGIVDRARALIEERQLEEALAAASGGIASGDFALATQFIDRAAEIDPGAPRLADVRRSLDEAVQRREEAQQREALEQRVRETVAEAERQFADGRRDDGVALLAAFRPSHPLVAQALERLRADAARLADEERAAADRAAQQAAEAAERARREAEARSAREREKAATDAIKEARRARGPEAALAILRPALERDPDQIDLLRAVGEHEAEQQRLQARAADEARRQAEKAEREKAQREKAEREKAERARAEREKAAAAAAAAQVLPGVPDADIDDRTILLRRDVPKPAAPATPSASAPASPTMPVAKEAPAVGKAPVATKAPEVKAPAARTPEPAKPAAAKAPAPPPPPVVRDEPGPRPAETGGLNNAVKYGGAAAAVLVAIVGFVVFGGGSSDEPPVDPNAATTVATNQAQVDDAATPPDDASTTPVDAAELAVAQQASAAPTTVPPTPPPARQPARPTAQQPAQQPARGQAAGPSAQDRQLDSLLADAQQLRDGGDLRTALERLEAGLKIRANDARFTALAGAIRQDADRRATAARARAQGVGATALSHVTYGEAENLTGQARAQTDPVEASRIFMAAEVRFNTAAVEGRRVADQQAAAAARPVTPAEPAQPTREQEEAAIRAVVERYRQAYNDLDARAVQAVFPSAPVAVLRKAFLGLERQSVTINNLVVAIDASGTTATATARPVVVVAKPRGASEQTTRNPMVLRLAKQGNTWVITGRK